MYFIETEDIIDVNVLFETYFIHSYEKYNEKFHRIKQKRVKTDWLHISDGMSLSALQASLNPTPDILQPRNYSTTSGQITEQITFALPDINTKRPQPRKCSTPAHRMQ